MVKIKRAYLRFGIWLYDIEIARVFDQCRNTGGDRSPCLEQYQQLCAEQLKLREHLARLYP